MLRHQQKWALCIWSNGCLTIEIEFGFHSNTSNHSLMRVSIRIEKTVFSHLLRDQVFPIPFFIEYFYMPTIKVRINEILYPTTRENGYGSLLYSCWHWVCCYHTSAINRCMTHGLFSISRKETHWSWIFFRLMSILYHYIFILHKTCYHECCCICP